MYTTAKTFSKGWYSHKYNGPGLWYEVAVSIRGGDIVWVNGPFQPGRWNDFSIFKEGLARQLLSAEKVEADLGYTGHQKVITPHNYRIKSMIEKAAISRSQHETMNRKLSF